MRILFLDIDGVLNSSRSFEAFNDKVKLTENYHTKLTYSTLDLIAVELVNKLTSACAADIVVSSSHRLYFRNDFQGMINYLRAFGITGNIIGVTPSLNNNNRGEEIQQWLAECKNKIDSYVILDDDGDMLSSQMQNFVQTSWEDGMLFKHYKKAMTILSKGNVITEPCIHHNRTQNA